MTSFGNDKGSPHFPNMDSDDVSVITASAKDVFKGHVLIDRLLVYYSKFEGSRSKAGRYAQKLLDLGHIESLTNSGSFQDSAHVYRWTDATKLGKTKAKDGAKVVSKEPVAQVFTHHADKQKHEHFEEIGKAILRISIETDNSKDTEIQARIRSSPRNGSHSQSQSISLGPKGVSAIAEDSFFGKRVPRTISYLTDATNDDLNRVTTPFITDVTTPEDNQPSLNKKTFEPKRSVSNNRFNDREADFNYEGISEIKNGPSISVSENIKNFASPRKQPFNKQTPLVSNKNCETIDQAPKVALLTTKSATDSEITTGLSPGANGTSKESLNVTRSEKTKGIASSLAHKPPIQASHETEHTTTKHTNTLQYNENKSPAKDQDCVEGRVVCKSRVQSDQPMHIASTQTSEKSILEASKIYNQNDHTKQKEKRLPSPAPRTLKMVEKNFPESSTQRIENGERKREEAKAKELQRVNSDQQQKKTRFSHEISKTSTASETAEINGINGVHKREEYDPVSEREMSLHSTGNADESKNFGSINEEKVSYIPTSPTPPSPNLRLSPGSLPQSFSMKSLFWIKIPNQTERRKHKVLWNEMEGLITFNHTEFEKLFSKPPFSSQTPRIKGDYSNERGTAMKVLGLERSRQVSIRANTIRLPIDEIHDAIISMDDEKLDLDALQALYDIRPTPEELDQIDDALKSHPAAILDKPEQFVLMLAMTPSLDERLRCWIFAKKFPDKIVDIQEQLLAVSEACNGIMESVTLRRVLEATLLLGNHMNRGTQRGDAYGFHLDILPKLKDVKSQNGETTLLEYIVRLIREQMKLEGRIDDQLLTPRNNEACGLPDAELLSRSISVSLQDIGDELENQAAELRECKEELLPSIIKASTIPSECETFRTKLDQFLEKASEKLRVQAQLYQDALFTAEDFQNYYIPKTDTDTKETVLSMLRYVSDFCADFRQLWYEIHREEIKEEFCKIQKLKRERQAEIQVRNTPSALKERFIMHRRRHTHENEKQSPDYKRLNGSTLTRTASGSIGTEISPHGRSRAVTPKRSYKFEDNFARESKTPQNGQQRKTESYSNGEQKDSYAERVSENSIRIEKRMKELHSKRNVVKYEAR